RNWPVATRLITLAAVASALGLALAGVRVAGAEGSARTYGQVARAAALGQQAAGLALDLEQERAAAAAFVAAGPRAAAQPALRRQDAITDGQAAAVRRLASGRPAPAGAASALASIAELPGLRRQALGGDAGELTVVDGYSAAIAGLFPVIDAIADAGGSPV